MTATDPDYGVDAPPVVPRLLFIGVAGIALTAAAPHLPEPYAQIARSLAVSGWCCGATALVMLWGSRFGKFHLRDRLLSRLPWFPDSSFDLIVSSFALHNIYQRAERERALAHIVRVLKPGGQLAVADIRHAPGYARFFRAHGLEQVRVSWPNFLFVTPTFTVTARKPGSP